MYNYMYDEPVYMADYYTTLTRYRNSETIVVNHTLCISKLVR